MEEAGVENSPDAIAKVLRDPNEDPQFRRYAALALGQLADKTAIPELVIALSDSEAKVRSGAAFALSCMPDDRLAQPLCRIALNDSEMAPRHHAVQALSRILNRDATNCLVTVATKVVETRDIRLLTLMFLSEQVAERGDYAALIPMLQDLDVNIRGSTSIALSLKYESEPHVLNSLSIVDLLVNAATDPDILIHIYFSVVKRLEQLAGQDFVSDLGRELDVMDPRVREEVDKKITVWAAEEASAKRIEL